jgi:dGTPase
MTTEENHRAAVKSRVTGAIALGFSEFQDILARCQGADPRLVAACIKELGMAVPSRTFDRNPSRELFVRLPAPDPFRSQWWFTGECVDSLVNRILTGGNASRVLCLGTPTVGHGLLRNGLEALVLDADQHVIDAVNAAGISPAAQCYDVADALPECLNASFGVVIIDPPWYEDEHLVFIQRALTALKNGGELLCTLPPALTRPDAEEFRNTLLRKFITAGHELLGLEPGILSYVVPRFEEVALAKIPGFRAIPWRHADLLRVRKRASAEQIDAPKIRKVAVQVFARSPHEFRVFLLDRQSIDPMVMLEVLDAYSTNVSTRAHGHESPDLWTTEKTGIRIGQLEVIKAALMVWQDVCVRSTDEAIQQLKPRLPTSVVGPDVVAKNVVHQLDKHLHLWSNFASLPPLRTEAQIDEAKNASLSEWATRASRREHAPDNDVFRAAYQRDRDRVLWSRALRRLAHKTQLFPTDHDDELRQRLTHSVEVMQLALTIGASFGLDRDLIEAGALAHDIGHTPFGHAGEHALHRLLDGIHSQLGGFNHYEHGVDVVRWLEGPYYVSSATPFHGLNLTPEVAECILKHTFCQTGNGLTAEAVLAISKHRDVIKQGYCHLEGQSVRVADKISYLVSDVEDGIRLGALTVNDLHTCRFFYRAPLNFTLGPGETLYNRYIEQRRNILKLLMEDVLVETNKHLARMKRDDVRCADEYTVNHSTEIVRDVAEIWERLQRGRLHEDRRVKLANLQAARIVTDLTVAFATCPSLVEEDFAVEHERLWSTAYLDHYRRRVGKKVTIPSTLVDFLSLEHLIDFKYEPGRSIEIDVEQLVRAKDFVAGLTDSRARRLHKELFQE